MSNVSLYVPWTLQTASRDDIIYIFVCAPVSILGAFLCAAAAYVLASNDFKEKLFAYLRLECILMTIDLCITSARSLAPVYMCRTTTKMCPPQPSLVPVIIDTYLYTYLPSPIEATALITDILAALTCLSMLKQNRNRFEQFIHDLNPYLVVFVAFGFNAVMFGYQMFDNALLFSSKFIIANRIYFDLITYSIRDGLFLMILLVLNGFIGYQVRTNLNKKIHIVDTKAKAKTRKSQRRTTIMVWADCINSALGRIPIFSLFVIKNVNKPLTVLVPLGSLCSLAVFLSYFLKFFIYLNFNKCFRSAAVRRLSFLESIFKHVVHVNFEHSLTLDSGAKTQKSARTKTQIISK